MESTLSGVGVLDKAMAVLGVVEAGPCSLAELVERSGLSRATAHRLATALVHHGLLRRADGRFALGARAITLGRAADASWPLASAAGPVLVELRDRTGESAQLWVRDGERRICLASAESTHGLRTIVGTGDALPLDQGSGGRALTGSPGGSWVASVEEREPGVASVSAPVVDRAGAVVAAIGVSGPVERLTRDPGPVHGAAVQRAAARLAADAALV